MPDRRGIVNHRDMAHQDLLALLVTCAAGYTMIYTGLAKRMLRLGGRGRCRRCGRNRDYCSCRR